MNISSLQTLKNTTIATDKNIIKQSTSIPLTYTIYYKELDAINALSKLKDKNSYVFATDKKANDGAKNYFISNYKHIYKHSMNALTSFYELHMPDDRVKLHFDLDITPDILKLYNINLTNSDEFFKNIMLQFLKLVKRVLNANIINQEDINDQEDQEDQEDIKNKDKPKKKETIDIPVIILKSDNKIVNNILVKLSAHIIYPTVVFSNIRILKNFCSKFKQSIINVQNIQYSDIFDKIFDLSIYKKGYFRLMHSTKMGVNCVLRFYDKIKEIIDYRNNEYDLFLKSSVVYLDNISKDELITINEDLYLDDVIVNKVKEIKENLKNKDKEELKNKDKEDIKNKDKAKIIEYEEQDDIDKFANNPKVIKIPKIAPLTITEKARIAKYDLMLEELLKKKLRNNIKEIYEVAYNLSSTRISTYNTWINFVLLCSNEHLKELCCFISESKYVNFTIKKQENLNTIDYIFKDPTSLMKNCKLTLSSLYFWSKLDNEENYTKIILKYKKLNELNLENSNDILLKYKSKYIVNTMIEDCPRITDNAILKLSEHKGQIVQANTGVGKTVATNKLCEILINKIIQQRIDFSKRCNIDETLLNNRITVLSIVSRQSMAYLHKTAFSKIELVSYLDLKKNKNINIKSKDKTNKIPKNNNLLKKLEIEIEDEYSEDVFIIDFDADDEDYIVDEFNQDYVYDNDEIDEKFIEDDQDEIQKIIQKTREVEYEPDEFIKDEYHETKIEENDKLLFNDEPDHTIKERFISSIEHLPTLKDRTYDIIILDEISSTLEHFYSSTMNKVVKKSFSVLCNLIMKAKYVIASDAIITDNVLNFLSSLIDKKDILYYRNMYQNKKNIPLTFYYLKHNSIEQDLKLFSNIIAKRVTLKEPFLLVSDSKEIINLMYTLLYTFNPNNDYFKVYTGDMGDKTDLMNPTKVWENRGVLCSPTVQYGVDANHHCPNTYAIFKGHSIDSFGMLQQISRARLTTQVDILYLNNISVSDNHNQYISFKELAVQEVTSIEKNNNYIVNKFTKDLLEIVTESTNRDNKENINLEKIFREMHLYHTWYRRLFSKDKSQLFIKLCEEQGYKINYKIFSKKEVNLKIDKKDYLLLKTNIEDQIVAIINNVKTNTHYVNRTDVLTQTQERINGTCKFLNLNIDTLKNDSQLVKFILDKHLFETTLASLLLFRKKEYIDNIQLKKYVNNFPELDKNTKIFKKLDLIEFVEKHLKIDRFEINKIDEDRFTDLFIKKFVKKLNENKIMFECFKLPTGIAIRKERIKNIIANITNKQTLKNFVVCCYNNIDDIFLNVSKRVGKAKLTVISYNINNITLVRLNVLIDLLKIDQTIFINLK
jgi:hypothetical protein